MLILRANGGIGGASMDCVIGVRILRILARRTFPAARAFGVKGCVEEARHEFESVLALAHGHRSSSSSRRTFTPGIR